MNSNPNWIIGKFNNATITTDIVVPIKFEDGTTRILTIERLNEPFKGMFALPGGIMDNNEEIIECAVRELKEETFLDLHTSDLDFINIYHKQNRDPRGRYITFAYICNKPIYEVNTKNFKASDDAKSLHYPIITDFSFKLAFDHNEIVKDAINRIKGYRVYHGLELDKLGYMGLEII